MDKAQLVQILEQQRIFAQQKVLRPIAERELDLSAEIEKPEISIITGVRRCGKSSFLSQLYRQHQSNYRTLLVEFDNPALEGFGGADFLSLIEICAELSRSTSPRMLLLLDEIQNTSGWEKWLTQIAKDRSVKIVATGSNAQLLSSEIATLLTGRHSSHEMTPLSFHEILQFEFPLQAATALTEDQLLSSYRKYYRYGGFPRSYIDNDASVLPQYFRDIVERDVIVRHGSRLKRQLKELAQIMCSDNTHLMNRSRVAKALGVKDNETIKRYSRWLEESYLFHEIKAFSPAIRKQIRSNPKFYCVDPAMARYSAFSVLGDEGAFLENSVYLELRRRGFELHYWRADSEAAEVDFIGRKAGQDPIAVQVSLSVADESTLRRELRGLALIGKELGIKDLILITASDPARDLVYEEVTVHILPFLRWAAEC
jgi:predicted AAA+ superfamily ATPase